MSPASAPQRLMGARVIVAVLVVTATAGGGVTHAGASVTTYRDGDDVGGVLDLAELSIAVDGGDVVIEASTYDQWEADDVTASAVIDTDGDGSFDWIVDVSSATAGTLSARGGATTDDVTVSSPASRQLRIVVDGDSIGDPPRADAQLVTHSELDDDGVVDDGELDVAGPRGDGDPVLRHAGRNRIATALAASKWEFAFAPTAVLARDDGFADALAGAPLAVAKGGPILLTGRDTLDPAVAAELRRLLSDGAAVHLLGGTAALTADIDDDIRALGYRPVRHAGADRFETALVIADAVGPSTGAVLADGRSFADALPASAAAASTDSVVVLTDGAALPAAARRWLDDRPALTRTAVGAAAVAAAPSATAIVGADRYATAVAVADRLVPDATFVAFASGEAFPDALAAAAVAGRASAPLLLTRPGDLPTVVAEHLERRADRYVLGAVYGGRLAVSDAAVGAAAVSMR